ncbi:MAG TPA: signal peptide peptidase SppA [Stellaceae bacterium]|nr:signal peptide peptidase SppA [Stellaceae bacterium]
MLFRFLMRLFATIGLLVVVVVGVGIALALTYRGKAPEVAANTVLELDFDKPVTDGAERQPLSRLLGGGGTTLPRVLETLRRAGTDDRVKGVIARVGNGGMGIAQIQELRDAIKAFRAKGKFAIAYAESFGEGGPGTGSYYLATAFDDIWLQPLGGVGLTGIRSEAMFLRGTLDKLGVVPRLDHREDYKTAMNMVTETGLTPAHRESLESTLGSIYGQIVAGIGDGRKLDPDKVKNLVDNGPYPTEEAKSSGLVDHVGYRDEAFAASRARAGANPSFSALSRYLSATDADHTGGTVIAILHANGMISRGDGGTSALSRDESVTSDSFTRAIRAAVADPAVKAILLRVDSPGGSAVASETIWRETVRARDVGKPLIVSMGDVAGSGGYYIAASADKIVAEPGTITGSIGVVGGKILLGGLYDKLGIATGAVGFGKNSDMFSDTADFSTAGNARFEQSLDEVYAGFKDRVARGRKLTPARVEEIAKGRIWSGEEAKANGLVDALGGYDVALDLVRAAAKLDKGAPIELRDFPRPRSPLDLVLAGLRDAGDTDQQVTIAPGLVRLMAALDPILRRVELLTAPPGSVTMPAVDFQQ